MSTNRARKDTSPGCVRGGDMKAGDIMSINVWFRRDVQRILIDVHTAAADGVGVYRAWECNSSATAYRRGYTDALQAVAVAFGLAEPGESGEPESPHAVYYRRVKDG